LTWFELDRADACLATGLRHALAAGNLLNQCLLRSRRAMGKLLRGDIDIAHAELISVEKDQIAAGFWGEAGLTSAQLAFADVLAGRPAAEDHLERALREWRRTGFPWNEALLSASRAAWMARSGRGPGRAASVPAPEPGTASGSLPADLPMSSAVAALSAVEAHDMTRTRAVARTAAWRHGFRGPVTMNNAAIVVALVEVGDLLGDSAMVRAGAPALEQMYERGALVVLGWPTTVPRLLAVTSRHAGDLGRARSYLDHARGLADREELAPERAKVLLEHARLCAASASAPDRAADADPLRSEAEAALSAAAEGFDRQSMHGWIARCDEMAQALRMPTVIGAADVRRERIIFTDDVVGSTAANVRLGDPLYLEQLRVHDRIVRSRLRAYRGVEVKHTGDGINAVFDEPSDAVRCALAVLADFRDWRMHEPDLALEIRCGLARGPVIPSGGDFYGLVQSEAARLCSLASAGEVLTNAAVVEAVEVVHAGDAGDDAAVEASGLGRVTAKAQSVGRRELKGFPEPVEVFRLTDP
jgi:class 3 adenylate cyclase